MKVPATLSALVCLAAIPARAADEALIAAAKKEGQVTWYTTLIVDQVARPMAQAFEKKYGVRVNYVRGDSVDLALRLVNEGKAGRVQSDVFDTTSALVGLKRAGLIEPYISESAARLPQQFRDPEGYWTATNLFVHTPSFNTSLVPRGTEPRTWADLLAPKWKGRMAWTGHATSSGGPGFVGVVLAELGEEKGLAYLRELAKQNITQLGGSARSVVDQVIAGEFPLALQTFNHQPIYSARSGAPADFIEMNPSMAVFNVTSLSKGAPRPAAGKLLLDFLVSPEGQTLFQRGEYIPVDPGIAPTEPRLRPDGVKFRAIFMTPEQVDAGMPKWAATFREIFR